MSTIICSTSSKTLPSVLNFRMRLLSVARLQSEHICPKNVFPRKLEGVGQSVRLGLGLGLGLRIGLGLG